jgi:uncharacterized protein (DUF433 family)
MQDYVEHRDGGYYVEGTRISLDSIIDSFNEGASPETILRSFPLIGSLERVYGTITFYLSHKKSVDDYMRAQDQLWTEIEAKQTPLPDQLAEKLRRAKETLAPR